MHKTIKKSTAMINIIMLVAGLALPMLGLMAPQSAQAAGWWNEDWPYRQVINISHAAAESNIYHQFQLDTSSSKFKADCSDMRFVDSAGQQIPYHIVSGCGTNNTQIQLLFSTLPAGDQDIYLYYGNQQAPISAAVNPFNNPASNVSLNSISSQQLSQGPVAHWKFDEGYGTTAQDSTTAANNGTLTNGPIWQQEDMCVSGKCLYFDGADDYVAVNDHDTLDLADGLTIGGWYKPTQPVLGSSDGSGTARQVLISKDATTTGKHTNYTMDISALGKVRMAVADGNTSASIKSTDILQPNQWYYIIGTFDSGGNLKLYIDGRLQAELSTGLSTLFVNTGQVHLGKFDFGWTIYRDEYKGFMDSVAIYPYARNQTQIQQDYVIGMTNLQQQGGNLSNGLVGYWKMDEASWNGTAGEVGDSSGNENNGAAQGGSMVGSGLYGNGATFDGVDDYVESGAALDSGDSTTLAAWVYPTSSAGTVIFMGSSRVMRIGCTDVIGLNLCGMTSASTDWVSRAAEGRPVKLNEWQHIAFTVENNKMLKLYLNGAPAGSRILAADKLAVAGSSAPVLGKTNWSWSPSHYEGSIDEARVYNRALTETEIQRLYNYAPKPVAYYDFEEGGGSTVYDKSGSGNNGEWLGPDNRSTIGQVGQSGSFDGISSCVDLSSSVVNLGKAYTVSFWALKQDSMSISQHIIDIRGDGVSTLAFRAIGDVFLRSTDGTPPAGGQLGMSYDVDKWSFYTATADGETVSVYKNGVFQASKVWNQVLTSESSWSIGCTYSSSAATNPFKGNVDEVRVYNYARNQQQIIEDMQASMTGQLNPVGYWKFDEGQGDTTNDSGLSKSSGILNNAQWADGINGSAITFNGVDSYVSLGDVQQYKTLNKTLSVWLNPSASPTNGGTPIFASGLGANWYVGLASGNRLIWSYGNSLNIQQTSYSNNSDLIINEWHHYTFTMQVKGQNITTSFYRDGELLRTNVTSNGIGFIYGAAATFAHPTVVYSGAMDEIKIYNSALTSQQISVDYNQSSASIIGGLSTEPATSGSGQATTQPSNSQDSTYCVPGSVDFCAKPVGEWKFEEKTGTTAQDSSGNGNNGTIYNGAYRAPGKHGSGLTFDGINDYVEVSPQDQINISSNAVTLSAWFKPNKDQSQYARLVHKGGVEVEYGLSFGENSTIRFLVNADGPETMYLFTTTPITDTTHWYYIVGVYDGATSRVYVDGKLIASQANTGNIASQDGALTIGGQVPYLSAGSIDDVRLYNYARTPSQIAWDYNNGKPIAHYKLDECSGTTIHDYSGNRLDGVLRLGSGGLTTAGTCNSANTAWNFAKNGRYNSAMSFDGIDDDIVVTSQPSFVLKKQLTLSAWINPKFGGNSTQNIINNGANWPYRLMRQSNNTLRGQIDIEGNGTGYISSPAGILREGYWQHVVLRFDGQTKELYLNGNRVASSMAVGEIAAPVGALFIGSCGTCERFNGLIDDVQIYNYALTQKQIDTLYNGGAVRWGQ